MNTRNQYRTILTLAAVAVATVVLATASANAALMLQLEAANYNPVTGTWSDTSGNNNHATQGTAASQPSFVSNHTANGSTVVRFDGVDDYFDLTSSITTTSAADGYTVFTYVRPHTGGTVVSGTVGSVEYRGGPKQRFVKTFVVDLGPGDATLSTTNFSSINGQINDTGGTFRLNGAADGTSAGNTFSPGITAVGHNDQGNNSRFSGDIAEIRVYNEQLTLPQIQAIEAEFTGAYEAPTGRVSLPMILNPTFDTNAAAFTGNNGVVGQGSNPAEIPNWAGTGTVRGINPGNGAGSAFVNNGNNKSQVAYLRDGSISQDISGFEVGKEYRISFDYNGRSGFGVPAMTATIGGASLVDPSVPAVGGNNAFYAGNILLTPSNAMETLTISQTAAGDSTLLLDNFRIVRNGPTIADNGFENPVQPANDWKQAGGGGTGDLTGALWTITDGAGISRNGAFHTGLPAPEGEQIALIQQAGSFEQTVSGFEVGAEYSLSLLTMRRLNGPGLGNDLEVLLDAGLASEIGLIDINEVTFASFTEVESLSFVATKDTYDLVLRGTNPLGGDRATFIDNVWFNQLTEAPLSAVPEPGTLILAILGFAGLVGTRRRRQR